MFAPKKVGLLRNKKLLLVLFVLVLIVVSFVALQNSDVGKLLRGNIVGSTTELSYREERLPENSFTAISDPMYIPVEVRSEKNAGVAGVLISGIDVVWTAITDANGVAQIQIYNDAGTPSFILELSKSGYASGSVSIDKTYLGKNKYIITLPKEVSAAESETEQPVAGGGGEVVEKTTAKEDQITIKKQAIAVPHGSANELETIEQTKVKAKYKVEGGEVTFSWSYLPRDIRADATLYVFDENKKILDEYRVCMNELQKSDKESCNKSVYTEDGGALQIPFNESWKYWRLTYMDGPILTDAGMIAFDEAVSSSINRKERANVSVGYYIENEHITFGWTYEPTTIRAHATVYLFDKNEKNIDTYHVCLNEVQYISNQTCNKSIEKVDGGAIILPYNPMWYSWRLTYMEGSSLTDAGVIKIASPDRTVELADITNFTSEPGESFGSVVMRWGVSEKLEYPLDRAEVRLYDSNKQVKVIFLVVPKKGYYSFSNLIPGDLYYTELVLVSGSKTQSTLLQPVYAQTKAGRYTDSIPELNVTNFAVIGTDPKAIVMRFTDDDFPTRIADVYQTGTQEIPRQKYYRVLIRDTLSNEIVFSQEFTLEDYLYDEEVMTGDITIEEKLNTSLEPGKEYQLTLQVLSSSRLPQYQKITTFLTSGKQDEILLNSEEYFEVFQQTYGSTGRVETAWIDRDLYKHMVEQGLQYTMCVEQVIESYEDITCQQRAEVDKNLSFSNMGAYVVEIKPNVDKDSDRYNFWFTPNKPYYSYYVQILVTNPADGNRVVARSPKIVTFSSDFDAKLTKVAFERETLSNKRVLAFTGNAMKLFPNISMLSDEGASLDIPRVIGGNLQANDNFSDYWWVRDCVQKDLATSDVVESTIGEDNVIFGLKRNNVCIANLVYNVAIGKDKTFVWKFKIKRTGDRSKKLKFYNTISHNPHGGEAREQHNTVTREISNFDDWVYVYTPANTKTQKDDLDPSKNYTMGLEMRFDGDIGAQWEISDMELAYCNHSVASEYIDPTLLTKFQNQNAESYYTDPICFVSQFYGVNDNRLITNQYGAVDTALSIHKQLFGETGSVTRLVGGLLNDVEKGEETTISSATDEQTGTETNTITQNDTALIARGTLNVGWKHETLPKVQWSQGQGYIVRITGDEVEKHCEVRSPEQTNVQISNTFINVDCPIYDLKPNTEYSAQIYFGNFTTGSADLSSSIMTFVTPEADAVPEIDPMVYHEDLYKLAFSDVRKGIKENTWMRYGYDHFALEGNRVRLQDKNYQDLVTLINEDNFDEELYKLAFPDVRKGIEQYDWMEYGYDHLKARNLSRLQDPNYLRILKDVEEGYDEELYTLAFPDVRKGIDTYDWLEYGYDHYNGPGRNEKGSWGVGRLHHPNYIQILKDVEEGYDEELYLLAFDDVRKAVDDTNVSYITTGYDHYRLFGREEKRLTKPQYKNLLESGYDEELFLIAFPDVWKGVNEQHSVPNGYAYYKYILDTPAKKQERLCHQNYKTVLEDFGRTDLIQKVSKQCTGVYAWK